MSPPPGEYTGEITRVERGDLVEVEITSFGDSRPVVLSFWQGLTNLGEIWFPNVSWPFPLFVPKARPYDWGFDGL